MRKPHQQLPLSLQLATEAPVPPTSREPPPFHLYASSSEPFKCFMLPQSWQILYCPKPFSISTHILAGTASSSIRFTHVFCHSLLNRLASLCCFLSICFHSLSLFLKTTKTLLLWFVAEPQNFWCAATAQLFVLFLSLQRCSQSILISIKERFSFLIAFS